MQRKNMRETKQRFTIKKFKVGVGSVLIGTILSGVMLPTAVLASELDSSTPLENSFLVEAPDLTIDQGGTPETHEQTPDLLPKTPEVTTTSETPTPLTTEISTLETNSATAPETTLLESPITLETTITDNTPTTIDDDEDDEEDDDKYAPVAKTLWVSPGTTITEEMIINQVSVPHYPESKKLTKKIENDDKIPTPDQLVVGAKFKVEVEVIYEDGSEDDIDVKIKVRKTHADQYNPTGGKLEVMVGDKITPDMIKEHITIPADAPIKEIKYGTIPTTETAGDKDPITVTIIYKDDSTDEVEVTVHVTELPTPPTDADQYNPTGGKLEVMVGDKITPDMIKEHITIPADAPIKEVKYGTIPTTETAGDKDPIKVTIIYKDGSTDEVEVTVHVTEKPTPPTDADQYNPTGGKLEVMVGDKITPDMIKEHITIPADAPIKEVKYGTIPTTETAGDKDPITVTIIYKDDSTDEVEVTVHVTELPTPPTYADQYNPTATKLEVPQGMNILDEMVKEQVTLPEDVEATITKISGSRDTMTPGDKAPLIVEVTYPDGTIDTVEVPLCVTDIPDNEVYEPTTGKIEVNVGTKITEEMVKEQVILPEGVSSEITKITDIPDTSTHGDKAPIQVEVHYADGSYDLVKVEVHVLDPNSQNPNPNPTPDPTPDPDPDPTPDPDPDPTPDPDPDPTPDPDPDPTPDPDPDPTPDKPVDPDNGGDGTHPDNGDGTDPTPDPDKPVDPDNGGDSTNPDNGGDSTNPDNGGDSTNPDNEGDSTKPDKPVDPDNGGDGTHPDNGDGTDPTKPNQATDIPQTVNHHSDKQPSTTTKPTDNITPLKSSSMSYMRLPQTSTQTLLEFASIGILMTGIGSVSLAKRKK